MLSSPTLVAGPTPAMPPHYVPSEEVCLYRYQDGSARSRQSQLCGCGTFSIGRCYRDGRFVCGDHSQLLEGKRLCEDCISSIRLERQLGEVQPFLDQLEQACGSLVEVRDPFDRAAALLRLRRLLLAPPAVRSLVDAEHQRILERAVSELFNGAELAELGAFVGDPKSWSIDAKSWVDHWQATDAIRAPLEELRLTEMRQGRFTNNLKEVTVGRISGWMINEGSAAVNDGKGSYSDGSPPRYLLVDATLSYVGYRNSIRADHPRPTLDADTAVSLAAFGPVRLPKLPDPHTQYLETTKIRW